MHPRLRAPFVALALAAACAALPLRAQAPPPLSPEQLAFQQEVGTWDAEVRFWMDPAEEPMVAKGEEVNTLIIDGAFLETRFTSTFGGQPYEGRGHTGFDVHHQRYISTWADTDRLLVVSTGKKDAQGALVLTSRRPDAKGRMQDWREVSTRVDADHRVFVMSRKDGKGWVKVMEIRYTRRK